MVVVDNYDSFTYNLCQYLGDLGADYVVYTNDEKTVDEILKIDPKVGRGGERERGAQLPHRECCCFAYKEACQLAG